MLCRVSSSIPGNWKGFMMNGLHSRTITAYVTLISVPEMCIRDSDISAGGLITTLLEMCFSNMEGGMEISLNKIKEDDIIKILFLSLIHISSGSTSRSSVLVGRGLGAISTNVSSSSCTCLLYTSPLDCEQDCL